MAIRYIKYDYKDWWFIGELIFDRLIIEKPFSAARESWSKYPLATSEQMQYLISLLWQVKSIEVKN